MNSAELDQLVAQIGGEILARVSRPALARSEGLNVPDLVCPGCTQRCPQTCAVKTREIIARDGVTVKNRFGETKEHPANAIERQAMAAFTRTIAQMGFDAE